MALIGRNHRPHQQHHDARRHAAAADDPHEVSSDSDDQTSSTVTFEQGDCEQMDDVKDEYQRCGYRTSSTPPTLITLTSFPFRICSMNVSATRLLGSSWIGQSIFQLCAQRSSAENLASHQCLPSAINESTIVQVYPEPDYDDDDDDLGWPKLFNAIVEPSFKSNTSGNSEMHDLSHYCIVLKPCR